MKYKNNIKLIITYNYGIDIIHVHTQPTYFPNRKSSVRYIYFKDIKPNVILNKHSVSITADGANFHIHKIFHQKIKRHCRAINICRNTSDSEKSLCNIVRNIRCHVCTRHLKSYQTLGTAKILFTISLNRLAFRTQSNR